MNVHLEKNKAPKSMERAYDLGMNKIKTPKSERPRASYGSLEISLQTTPGLCPERKCVRKENHEGDCWPKETV